MASVSLRLKRLRSMLTGRCCGMLLWRRVPAAAPPAVAAPGFAAAAATPAVEAGSATAGDVGPQQQQQRHQHKRERRPPRPPRQPRPNYFLALQLSHEPAVVAAARRVQASLAAHSPLLERACVDAESLHLTMGVLALHDDDAVATATAALRTLPAALRKRGALGAVEMELAGLGHFNNQVLFLRASGDGDGERLSALAALVADHFGPLVQAQPGRPFAPHVTLAKLSRVPRSTGSHRWGGGRGRRGAQQQHRHHHHHHGAPGGAPGGTPGGVGGQEGVQRQQLHHEEEEEGPASKRPRQEHTEDEEGVQGVQGMAAVEQHQQHQEGKKGEGEEEVEGPQEQRQRQQQQQQGSSSSGQDCGEHNSGGAAGAMSVPATDAAPAPGNCPPSSGVDGPPAGNPNADSVDGKGGDKGGGAGGGSVAGVGAASAARPARGEPPPQPPPRFIDEAAYAQHLGVSAGRVVVREMQLCAMQGRVRGSYYRVHCSVSLLGDDEDETGAGADAAEVEAGGGGGATAAAVVAERRVEVEVPAVAADIVEGVLAAAAGEAVVVAGEVAEEEAAPPAAAENSGT